MADRDLQSVQAARDLVEAAHRAQATLAGFDQAKIDAICDAMAKAAERESLRLATLAHEETGYGNAVDKNVKNLFSAVQIHNYFKGLRTVGVIRDAGSVIEIASPRGVVAAIIPSTNPTSTAIFKILIAIKSRNSVVLSPHPSATRCVVETSRVMRDAGVAAGLPSEAVGWLEATTIEGTDALMKHKLTSVILATGGLGLVRAAYSSGKPAFGVGPGNVPALIDRNADTAKAVRDVLAGKCFDFGTICASEQAVVVDAPVEKDVRAHFTAQGAFFLTSAQADELARLVVTPQRSLNPKIVGKPATKIAEMAGITVPPNTRCLMAEVGGVGRDFPLSIEKLSPILAYYVVDGIEEGSQRCDQILHYGGMGHTAAIHSRDRETVLRYGLLMPAARVIVNSPATHGAIGYSTALPPSMTLGCGSWGGNVTSDNISPLHLMDIKRVAFEVRPVTSAAEEISRAIVPPLTAPAPSPLPAATVIGTPQAPRRPVIDRAAISALVDRFLAERGPQVPTIAEARPEPVKPAVPAANTNGRSVVDFVCEEDVRRAIAAGEKIYVSNKTIITPAARELGDTKEVFGRN
jgi:acetaldehyde dehydrogenase (acetylating)